jgi:prolipoprotein diacylglyceryl transferase
LSSHGGIIGILIGVYIWCRKNHADYLFVLDRLAIVACVAGGCIRLGNLMNSEIIGVPATVPWAFVFERVDNLPRHPAQLYEAVFYISLFLVLLYIWYHYSPRLHRGMMLGLALTVLWVFRFFIEMIKENQSSAEGAFLLNTGQLLSLPFILLGLYLMARKTTQEK